MSLPNLIPPMVEAAGSLPLRIHRNATGGGALCPSSQAAVRAPILTCLRRRRPRPLPAVTAAVPHLLAATAALPPHLLRHGSQPNRTMADSSGGLWEVIRQIHRYGAAPGAADPVVRRLEG